MIQLVIAHPWPLVPYSRRHKHSLWRRTRMFVVLVACSTEKTSLPESERRTLSAANELGLSMRSSGYFIFFDLNFYSADATTLINCFLTSSKTTGFLPPLHTTLGRVLDQTKMVDGISLEFLSKVLIILNCSLID